MCCLEVPHKIGATRALFCWEGGGVYRQEASITWCDLFRPKCAQKTPRLITSHDVLEPLKQVVSASRDVIISGQIWGLKLQSVFTLGDGCWLPSIVRHPRNISATSRKLRKSAVRLCARHCVARQGHSNGVRLGCDKFPGRNYIRPPPSPFSGQKAFSRGGGWGCIFWGPARQKFYTPPPLLYTPHP